MIAQQTAVIAQHRAVILSEAKNLVITGYELTPFLSEDPSLDAQDDRFEAQDDAIGEWTDDMMRNRTPNKREA